MLQFKQPVNLVCALTISPLKYEGRSSFMLRNEQEAQECDATRARL